MAVGDALSDVLSQGWDPNSGKPPPAGQFTQPELDRMRTSGQITYQQYRGAVPAATVPDMRPAPPPPPAPDLRYGTNAAGQANMPPAPPPALASAPAGPSQAQGPLQGVPYNANPGGQTAPPQGMSAADAMKLASMGGGPGRPAGFTPNTRTTEGVNYSPTTLDAVGASMQSDRDLAMAKLNAAGAQGGAQRQADAQIAAYDEATARQQATRAKYVQQKMGEYHTHVQNMMQNAQDASEIDPDHFWNSKGFPQRLALAIGMMGQGFVWGMKGGESPADVLNKMIQQDVEGQKAKAQGARQKAADAQNLYDFNKAHFADEDRATAATEMAKRQVVINSLQRQVADRTAPAMGQLAMQQTIADLNGHNAATLRDLDEKTAKQTVSESFHQAAGPGGDVLATMKRARDIQNVGNELGGVDIGTRKGEADIAHTVAETNKTNSATTGGSQKLNLLAGDLKSTSLWDNAYGYLTRNIQNSSGQDIAIKQDAYNANLRGLAHQNYGARTPEAQDHLVGNLLIQPNDNPETIRRKVNAARSLFSGAPSSGVPAGVTPDTVQD